VIAAGLRADELPVKQPRTARRLVTVACAVVERRNRVLLVRRQPGELLAGTWALPSLVVDEGVPPAAAARAAAAHSGVVAMPGTAAIWRGSVRHVFTHRDVTAQIFAVPEAAPPAAEGDWDRERDPDRRWVDPGDLTAGGVKGPGGDIYLYPHLQFDVQGNLLKLTVDGTTVGAITTAGTAVDDPGVLIGCAVGALGVDPRDGITRKPITASRATMTRAAPPIAPVAADGAVPATTRWQ
jgi:ADP-ribose pyrophosphatase YjhB (NUDIX family)